MKCTQKEKNCWHNKRKTSYGDIKTYPKLKTKTFDSAGTLLSPEKKLKEFFKKYCPWMKLCLILI